MEPKPAPPPEQPTSDSLDTPTTVVEGNTQAAQQTGVISAENAKTASEHSTKKLSFAQRIANRFFGLNIYLLLFIFVLVVAGAVTFFTYNYSKRKENETIIGTTNLSQETLDQLARSDVSVGTPSRVLNVQSSAVFAGKILARNDLEVAGNLQVGGNLNLATIAVNDTANLGQVTVSRNLAVTGDTAVQGQQTIGGTLQVNGRANFSGGVSASQISTNSLQLTGDLTITRHITVGGGNVGRSNGGALGSGGTSSVSGSDTAGTVTINTGSGPSAGCFITINFTNRYNSTPRVIVTPIGSAAGALNYYVNRSTSNFSICSSSTPPAGSSFGFDYFIAG